MIKEKLKNFVYICSYIFTGAVFFCTFFMILLNIFGSRSYDALFGGLTFLAIIAPFIVFADFIASGDVPLWRCFLYVLPGAWIFALLIYMTYSHMIFIFLCTAGIMALILFGAYKFSRHKAFKIIKAIALFCFFALVCKLLAESLYSCLKLYARIYEWEGIAHILKYLTFLERLNEDFFYLFMTDLMVLLFMPFVMCFDFKSKGKVSLYRGIIYLASYIILMFSAVEMLKGL